MSIYGNLVSLGGGSGEGTYANGDIAELTTDSVSTSRRARLYILGDPSDDNYITIKGQYLQHVTGSVTSQTPVQETNRKGLPLYWQREPVSHDSDGYPFDANGAQIYSTTVPTSWPVYTYQYTELVKASFAFENESGTYVPIITVGVGDENGNNKGRIHKSADGLDIFYSTTAGDTIGIQALAAGYLDLYGLRKPTALDFSGWDGGTFSETLDGDVEVSFAIDFDAQDRPIKFTDGDGHETVVTWDAV